MSSTRVFESLDELSAAQGQELGAGPWFEVTQDRIDAFAAATGDHQWIHVDSERAEEGPYGATIAHGFLTLSLVFMLGRGVFEVRGKRMSLNYGLDRVRFPQPVAVGSRIRAVLTLGSVERASAGTRAEVRYSVEIEGERKLACIADAVILYVG